MYPELKVNIDYWQRRASLASCVRDFMAKRQVLEVMTPLLRETTTLDPNIESLAVQMKSQRLFLQTSPEFAMKILLGHGIGDIYQLSSVFRDEPFIGPLHAVEFLMLEWYRERLNYQELAQEVIDLLKELGVCLPVKFTRIAKALKAAFGFEMNTISTADLEDLTRSVIPIDQALNRQECFDLLLCEKVLPQYKEQILVLFDFPPCMAAMAKMDEVNNTAMRFEVYVWGEEIANGYQELVDPAVQKQRFEDEQKLRQKRAQTLLPIDQELLKSLATAPETSGVALGLDRLLWLKDKRGI